MLLLHGFPTSSFQHRELIPRLADKYRIIAPDLPGFGFTAVPEERRYQYTFDSLAKTMLAFTDALSLTKYAMYVFDYGAPTGFRMAMERLERVTAIVSQNGNAYEQGLGDAWAPIQRYWREPTQEHRNAIRAGLNLEGLRQEYSVGIPDPALLKPEGYTLDAALLARPGNADIQLDLFLDYANNVSCTRSFGSTFDPRSLRYWPCGANSIPISFRPVLRLSGETTPTRQCNSWKPGISRSKHTSKRSQRRCGNFFSVRSKTFCNIGISTHGNAIRHRDYRHGRRIEIPGVDAWQTEQAGRRDRAEIHRRLLPQGDVVPVLSVSAPSVPAARSGKTPLISRQRSTISGPISRQRLTAKVRLDAAGRRRHCDYVLQKESSLLEFRPCQKADCGWPPLHFDSNMSTGGGVC